jgi:hypothetical protein
MQFTSTANQAFLRLIILRPQIVSDERNFMIAFETLDQGIRESKSEFFEF